MEVSEKFPQGIDTPAALTTSDISVMRDDAAMVKMKGHSKWGYWGMQGPSSDYFKY